MATNASKTFEERFGFELRQYRRTHNICQEDFAKKFNITRPALSNIEKGKVTCNLLFFARLLEVVGTYAIYMLLIAYFGDALDEYVRLSCPEPVRMLYKAWVSFLEKSEPVKVKRHYDYDSFRVRSKYNAKKKPK